MFMYRVSLVVNRSDNRAPGKPIRANRMLALVACAQFLGMTLWFSATAAAPAIASEFQIARSTSAWLTMAVQAGFVLGTLLSSLMNLADVLNPRRLFAAGCLVGAVANASIVYASTPATIIGLRGLTGMALACVYPPGMKIVAGWFQNRRGTALGIMVGALTLGSALPHLLAWGTQTVAWRILIWISSALALAGGAVMWLTVSDGPYVTASAPFDARAVLDVVRNRGVRLSTLAYLGHMWELYAMWTWISTFTTAPLVDPIDERVRIGSLVAFTAIASGAAGCVVAGIWADDFGKARVARLALLTSAACCASAGLFFRAPTPVLLIFAIVWGFAIVADSAQFSALVSEYSPRTQVGTSLTLQTAVGFLLTIASIRLLPWVASIIGWRWTFLVLVPGPVLGAVAMSRLMNPSSLIPDRESLIPESSHRD
jgi:MFS family permease